MRQQPLAGGARRAPKLPDAVRHHAAQHVPRSAAVGDRLPPRHLVAAQSDEPHASRVPRIPQITVGSQPVLIFLRFRDF